jgi:hypothetical protein
VKGAINVFTYQHFMKLFSMCEYSYHYVVVYCEFSSFRAPTLIDLILLYDKFQNAKSLFFQKLYLLEGGYSKFFKMFRKCCKGRYRAETKSPPGQEGVKQFHLRDDMIRKVKETICSKPF